MTRNEASKAAQHNIETTNTEEQNMNHAPLAIVESTSTGFAVTSEVLAQGTGVQHASVLRLIDDNMADLEEFGGVRFEIRPFETAGGTQTKRVAMLNEQQGMLMLTFSRNTPQVKQFKVALIKEFVRMREALNNPVPVQEPLVPFDYLVLEAERKANVKVIGVFKELAPAKKYVPERWAYIAELARAQSGHWVGFDLDDMKYEGIKTAARDINTGRRHGFQDGEFEARTLNKKLHVRHKGDTLFQIGS